MKKTFQWLSAMALIVMGACMSVACSSDSDGGGGGTPDNSKLVGTWIVQSVLPTDGPRVDSEMTFKADGTFTQGRDQGTYTYDSSKGTFTAKINGMTMQGSFRVDGDFCTGSVVVTSEGRTRTYTITLKKKDSGGGEEVVIDERMVGNWIIMRDEGDPAAEGKTLTFKADGTWVIANYQSGKCTSETKGDGRIVFNIFDDEGNQMTSGKLVVVSGGNVLTGEYGVVRIKAKTRGSDDKDKFGIVLKRPNYTYPSANNNIKGRWEMTECNIPGSPVGSIFVFGEAPELYIEGDPHIDSYSITYTNVGGKVGGELTMTLDNGPEISGSFTIDGATVTLTGTASMEGQSMPVTAKLYKQ